MIKVLYISTSAFNSGIGSVIINYFRNIDNNKIHIDMVFQKKVDPKIKNEIEKKGCKIFELYTKDGKRLKQNKPILYMKKLNTIMKQNNYDIVEVHNSSSLSWIEMFVAKKNGVKVRIVHSHNTNSDYKILDKICKPLMYRYATDYFACGQKAGEWLFKNNKFYIIKNGKNIDEFKYNEIYRNEIRNKFNIKDNEKVIGCIANFSDTKNHSYLIDIMKCLDNSYKLLLVGTGDLESLIKEKVKSLNLINRVIFAGRTEEINKYLSAMDLFILVSKFEGLPNVAIEAQISVLPCIFSNKITNEIKLTKLAQFESIEISPQIWAQKIKNIKFLDRNKEQLEIIKQIKISGYDIKENSKNLEKLYENILSNRR